MKATRILIAAVVAATLAGPAVVQAQTTSTTSTVTTTTIPPFHNEAPVQYDAGTSTFTIDGAKMSKAQAEAYFQRQDPLYWPTLQAEFESTPAEFADHWNQLAFNLPALMPPADMGSVSPDAPL